MHFMHSIFFFQDIQINLQITNSIIKLPEIETKLKQFYYIQSNLHRGHRRTMCQNTLEILYCVCSF